MIDDAEHRNYAGGRQVLDEGRKIKIEVYEKQSEIIRIQSGIIDELILLLCRLLDEEELNRLSVLDKVDKVTELMVGL